MVNFVSICRALLDKLIFLPRVCSIRTFAGQFVETDISYDLMETKQFKKKKKDNIHSKH